VVEVGGGLLGSIRPFPLRIRAGGIAGVGGTVACRRQAEWLKECRRSLAPRFLVAPVARLETLGGKGQLAGDGCGQLMRQLKGFGISPAVWNAAGSESGCAEIASNPVKPGKGEAAGGISEGLAAGAESNAARKPAAGLALMSAVRKLSRTKSWIRLAGENGPRFWRDERSHPPLRRHLQEEQYHRKAGGRNHVAISLVMACISSRSRIRRLLMKI